MGRSNSGSAGTFGPSVSRGAALGVLGQLPCSGPGEPGEHRSPADQGVCGTAERWAAGEGSERAGTAFASLCAGRTPPSVRLQFEEAQFSTRCGLVSSRVSERTLFIVTSLCVYLSVPYPATFRKDLPEVFWQKRLARGGGSVPLLVLGAGYGSCLFGKSIRLSHVTGTAL